MTRTTRRRTFLFAATFAPLALAGSAFAQDSVANAPGSGGDALSPYGTQTVRFVLDLDQFQSSWGTDYTIGPIAKASRDDDVLFNTLALGANAVSPDRELDLAFPSTSYSLWSSRGAGVGPLNTAPGSLSIAGYDVRFGVGLSDLNADATNVIGHIVGLNTENLTRLFVRRTVAAQSRVTSGTEDTGTLSLGAIDASGQVHLRADGFNGTGPNAIQGENLLRINLSGRSSALNGIFWGGATNTTLNASASTFLINNGGVTTNTPATLPSSQGGPHTLSLDFAGTYALDGGSATSAHLDPAIDAHRGNPTYAPISDFGGVGAVASLARSASGLVDSLNAFGVDAAGAVVGTASATLPSPIPGFPALNPAGEAEFLQYLSQTSFRGPSGLVALGRDAATGDPILVATATDPNSDDFIGVARLAGGGPVWTAAAWIGQPVLDGPGGSSLGQIVATAPASFSAPAADSLGNVYFVATYDPALGAPRVGFFKAVNTASGYQLELLVEESDQFHGPNSDTDYSVDRIMLGDSDSIASAGFNAAHLLSQQHPTHTTTTPSDSTAFGGAILAAEITYNNMGTPEAYEALMFVGAYAPPVLCPGDIDGDGDTDVFDFGFIAGNFGSMVTPGTNGDLTGDGVVDVFDFAIFSGDFGCGGSN